MHVLLPLISSLPAPLLGGGNHRHLSRDTTPSTAEQCLTDGGLSCSLVAPVLAKYMAAKSAEFSGVVRTTVAPTVLQAGSADNVLPQEGSVIFNFRPMPGQDTPSE